MAKKLSVSLLIPLTATTLPAFLLLTIVPMIIGITQ
jgi:pilus assembly protein TadC